MNTLVQCDKKISTTLLELVMAFSLSFVYFLAMTYGVRGGWVMEALICIAFPIAVLFYARKASLSVHPRVLQLILIESLFMFLVILAKIAILTDHHQLDKVIQFLFRALFPIQFGCFMVYQWRVKSWLGFIRTALFMVLVIPWLSSTGMSDFGSEGQFFFVGQAAPNYIVLYYCLWVIGIPLVDSKTLPNLLSSTLHFSSVLVALLSAEFFHIRLLTASHLFILDVFLRYSQPQQFRFAHLSKTQFQTYNRIVKPCINWLTLLGCMMVFAANLSKLRLTMI